MGEDYGLPEVRLAFIQDQLAAMTARLTRIKENAMDLASCDTICEECIDESYDTIVADQPWFEDGILAKVGKIVSTELIKTGSATLAKLGITGVTKALKKGVGSFILARLKGYTTIYPEIDPISEFDHTNYDLVEATQKFNINFKLAMKWGEKIDTRVEVRVFKNKKSGKPAFALAYGKLSKGPMYNTEFVWLDNKYKKYTDFYMASAHAQVSIGHPSIDRMLKTIRAEWKEMKAKQKEVVQERVEEAWANDQFDMCRKNAYTAYEAGLIDQSMLAYYLEEVELASIHPTDDWCMLS